MCLHTTQRHTTLTMSGCLFGYLPRSREMLSVGGTHLASSNNKCFARRKNVWRREDCRSVHQQMPRVHFVSVLFMRTHNALSTSIIIITILLYRSYTMSSVVLRISYCLFLQKYTMNALEIFLCLTESCTSWGSGYVDMCWCTHIVEADTPTAPNKNQTKVQRRKQKTIKICHRTYSEILFLLRTHSCERCMKTNQNTQGFQLIILWLQRHCNWWMGMDGKGGKKASKQWNGSSYSSDGESQQ